MSTPIRAKRFTRYTALAAGVALILAIVYALPHIYTKPFGGVELPAERNVPPALADLPAVYYDGHDADGPVAILLSGSGGWWGLCDELAQQFANARITTIGLNSLAYFLWRRTPAGTAKDIKRIASSFDSKRPILLIGFSFGADIAATIYSDLDPALQARIKLVSLVGLSRGIRYGIGIWQVASENRSTAPAVAHISGPAIQCFVGHAEGHRSACPALDPKHVEIITMPGGHHLGGDYASLARHVLDGWRNVVAKQTGPVTTPG